MAYTPDQFTLEEEHGIFPVLRLDQGVRAAFPVALRDRMGSVIPLDSSLHSVSLIFRESIHASGVGLETACTVADGKAVLNISGALLDKPGVWMCQFNVIQKSNSECLWRVRGYADISPDFGSSGGSYPLVIDDIRTYLRDMTPEDNPTLAGLELRDLEIARGICRAVEVWNGVSPRFRNYSPITFPYRAQWIDGAIAEALSTVAGNLVRNRDPISVGGVNHDKDARADVYMQQSRAMKAEYLRWCENCKVAENMSTYFGWA